MCICKKIFCCFKKKNKTKKELLPEADFADTKSASGNNLNLLDIDIHTKTTFYIRQTSSFYESSGDDIVNFLGEIEQDN